MEQNIVSVAEADHRSITDTFPYLPPLSIILESPHVC